MGFWLTLGGSLVRDDISHSHRRLEGCEAGLVVGRSHQLALHNKGIHEDVQQYLSRKHFCIERTMEGWCVSRTSANPMWRIHCGVRTEVTSTSLLADGDRITLFTGAIDGTLDGPGSLGTLYWDFSCASLSSHPAQPLDEVSEGKHQPACVQNALPASVPREKPAFSGLLTSASTGTRGCESSSPCEAAETTSRHTTILTGNPTAIPASHPSVAEALQAPFRLTSSSTGSRCG